jgi:tetratricopeptide (TPR) repeat protein
VSSARFFGILCFSISLLSTTLHAQFKPAPATGIKDEFPPSSAGPLPVPLLTASGEDPFAEDMFEHAARKPISGVVSLRELEHSVPKKALKEAYEGQRFGRANNIPRAIAKLEKAIQIDPEYRDGHLNLGVQYARIGRTADARSEFQKALDIGPPVAPIFTDLALTSVFLKQYREAEAFARKALELDPLNRSAQLALQSALSH